MFTSLRRTTLQVISSHLETTSKFLAMVKLLSQLSILFQKVLLVESLDYNLLSVSQLCEMVYNCLFTNKGVTVFRRSDSSFSLKVLLRGKLHLLDFIPEEVELDKCLIAKRNMVWL
jgi:hypothetical protein